MVSQLRFPAELRRRLLPHGAVVFVLWPIASILFAALRLDEQPMTAATPFKARILGLSLAAARMLPEFVSVGLVLIVLSGLVFGLPRRSSRPRPLPSPILMLAEPVLVMLALFTGLALEYPALLHHLILAPLRRFSAMTVTFALCLALVVILFVFRRVSGSALAAPAMVLLLVPAGWLVARAEGGFMPGRAGSRTTLILGLDSVSQEDDVSILRSLTKEFSGTWFEKPVTPGLLTNSVWAALIMHRPVRETGVVFIYQQVDWSRSPFQLVRRAASSGCETVSYFSDQFTTYVGATAGFDRVRSGPKGWLQLATASLKDGSVFLPVVLPLLPRLPGARTPANQSGTFAFDLRREIHAMLTESGRPCALVAGHLDYLHQPLYPRYSELTAAERSIVWRSAVEGLQDLSLDWNLPVIPGDEINLYGWKLRRLQNLLAEEIRTTGYLDPLKGNRLVLFSDHGNRRALTDTNFGRPRYHHVILATFGAKDRDPALPISILDVPQLLSFEDDSRPGPEDPAVEYTNANADELQALFRSASLGKGGEILIPRPILSAIAGRLRRYRPYSGDTGYSAVPARVGP